MKSNKHVLDISVGQIDQACEELDVGGGSKWDGLGMLMMKRLVSKMAFSFLQQAAWQIVALFPGDRH